MQKDTETFQKLIKAAACCFSERGFSATSVKEIAARAGISQGAMYTYFKSKDDLIAAIVLEEQHSALEKQGQDYTTSHFQRLCDLVVSCISDVGYPVTHNLWVEILAESARNPKLRETFVESDKAMRKGIARIIDQGVSNGEFRPGIRSREATLYIFALMDGLIARKAIDPNFSVSKSLPSFVRVLRSILS
ncbi:TetR family transcriptional regulator [Advenella kashmirensis W13003]|uniref:TetR family transcriptional regulator n=1 Tax=Advenella kashmirensis W13003 TaxID=1424334 RepID=V8QRI0_9BURK|nr:TetR/AcrR family transcriptional regulator [Advenella kashmirensis]ETF01579.1 TetR family transcriptional regulator [Advenella kashmirensis W13003]